MWAEIFLSLLRYFNCDKMGIREFVHIALYFLCFKNWCICKWKEEATKFYTYIKLYIEWWNKLMVNRYMIRFFLHLQWVLLAFLGVGTTFAWLYMYCVGVDALVWVHIIRENVSNVSIYDGRVKLKLMSTHRHAHYTLTVISQVNIRKEETLEVCIQICCTFFSVSVDKCFSAKHKNGRNAHTNIPTYSLSPLVDCWRNAM